jgi:hypothetical protein
MRTLGANKLINATGGEDRHRNIFRLREISLLAGMISRWSGTFAVLLMFSCVAPMKAAQGPGWVNPLNLPTEPAWGVADPGVLNYRGYYYLYATGGDVRVWSSTDLVNWADRGLCLVGPLESKAWAPRPLYYNGLFYLYCAGASSGEAVYSSSSPMGPFTLVRSGLVQSIDACPYLNDNGQLYLYYAANGGIRWNTMNDPLNLGGSSGQFTGCKIVTINDWTEAPHVTKIDSGYFMSYTGNDWQRTDYQVHMARGSSPTTFAPQSSGNPILKQTTGTWTSTGCADFFRGPDLKTIVTAYHVRNGSYRKFCVDTMGWNAQGNLVANGPHIGTANPGLFLADFTDYLNRSTIGGNYVNIWGGNWTMDSAGWAMIADSRGQTGFKKELININTAANYVTEVTMRLLNKGASQFPKYGIVVSDNGNPTTDNGFYAFVDDNSKVLATISRMNGAWGTWQNANLPNWDMTKYHDMRIHKNGNNFEIYFDGMLKMTRTVTGFSGGKIGFVTEDCNAAFGWATWANW